MSADHFRDATKKVAMSAEPVAWKCDRCGNTSECQGAIRGDNWCNSCGACNVMHPLYDRATLDAAVSAARADERERCAKLVDVPPEYEAWEVIGGQEGITMLRELAAAIRNLKPEGE